MRKVAVLSSILALTLLSGVAYADNNWYVELDGGYRLNTIDKTADSFIQAGQSEPDTYTPSSVSNSGVAGFGFGYRFYTGTTTWFTHDDVGLRYQYISPATIDGTVNVASQEGADNFDYNYSLTQNTVFVTDKLALVKLGAFIPYIQLGAGTSINQVSQYSETAKKDIYVRDAAFAANNYLKFAYMGGVGVDINLSPQWKLNVAYEYDSPSDVQTGLGSSDAPDEYLTNTVSNNEVTIGFQYLFGIKSFN